MWPKLRDAIGERLVVGAQGEGVAPLEPVRRDRERRVRDDPPGEDDLGRARVGEADVPAGRAVPEVVAGPRSGPEGEGLALRGGRPAAFVTGRGGRDGRPRSGRKGRGRDEERAGDGAEAEERAEGEVAGVA